MSSGWAPDTGSGVPQHGDHGRAGATPEGAVTERAPDRPAAVGYRDPLDLELTERELEVVDDLWSLVRPSEDDGELPRLLVVELEDDGRLVVAPALHVDLALAGEMLHHRDRAPCTVVKVNLTPTPGNRVSFSSTVMADQSTLGRNRRRPSC